MMPLLPPGSRVAVIAPSHAFTPARLDTGLHWAREHGFEPVVFPNLLAPHRRFSATVEARRNHLVEALSSADYDAVWIVRGGSGMLQLLDDLPYETLVPRPVIGFSDVTALFCALDSHGDWPLIHGPVLHSIGQTDEPSLTHLEQLLSGHDGQELSGTTWVSGDVSAPIVGGNLTMLASTCGTRHQLKAAGRIVLIEEIGELPYSIERSVQQLISSGVLTDAAAIALGEFKGCRPPSEAAWTLQDGLRELLEPLNIPILAGLPIGHGAANHAFRWNGPAHISRNTLTL